MDSTQEIRLLLEPLSPKKLSDNYAEKVCHNVWNWPYCEQCNNEGHCSNFHCSWKRLNELQPYLRFFGEASCSSQPADLFEPQVSLRNEDDIFSIIRVIKKHPSSVRSTLMAEYFASYNIVLSEREQNRAFDLAMYLLTMTYCSSKSVFTPTFSTFPTSSKWSHSDSALDFVRSAFPTSSDNSFFTPQNLTAKALEKSKMKICATDDLRRHLLYDHSTKTVFVFRLASFLKECLNIAAYGSSQESHILPEQLVYETLQSLQLILFPWDDIDSRKIATRQKFDPACLIYDTIITHSDGSNGNFVYWGERLRILENMVKTAKQEEPKVLAWVANRPLVELIKLSIAAFTAIVTVATLIVGMPIVWRQRGKGM